MSGTWPRTLRCLQGDLPSVADPLIDCATTSFAINKKSCTGLRADRLPMHDRGSCTAGIFNPRKRARLNYGSFLIGSFCVTSVIKELKYSNTLSIFYFSYLFDALIDSLTWKVKISSSSCTYFSSAMIEYYLRQ